MSQASEILRTYLSVMAMSPDALGAECDPHITGQSVRAVLRGEAVGAKVALALARKIPALSVEMVIDPDEGVAPKRPPFRPSKSGAAA